MCIFSVSRAISAHKLSYLPVFSLLFDYFVPKKGYCGEKFGKIFVRMPKGAPSLPLVTP